MVEVSIGGVGQLQRPGRLKGKLGKHQIFQKSPGATCSFALLPEADVVEGFVIDAEGLQIEHMYFHLHS